MDASASSSTSYTSSQVKNYDVFLSFRGEDTRYNFTSHLYAALCRKKIETFIDNQLIRGDEISASLLNTIKASNISVIVFSKEYASSRWCLQELEQILECRKTNGQILIPVFYHVDPSDVRNQKGSFGDGFAELEERFKEKLEMLQRWRIALKEAADLSGWPVNEETLESVIIEEIVRDVLKRLNKLSLPSDNNNLVGVKFAIKRIESLLHIGGEGVCIVGIWGIGGIGKTTISRAVFDKINRKFERTYFFENLREESGNRLTHLQNKFLSEVLEDGHANIGSNFTKERLGRMKVLIVFDDVTCLEQIEKLIGDLNSLGSGSRAIITTRDKQVLKNCGVHDVNIYEVGRLSNHNALQLFSQYAFRQNCPTEDFMELSDKLVTYAKGLPLALKVLGSSLFSKGKEVWESAINKLGKGPPLDIQKVLKVSYDALDQEEKEIFLDISCFFISEDIDSVTKILDASNFFSKYGISVLIDKCLINVFSDTIRMHDLLQEMGRKIIREESKNDPCKFSQLWHHKDIHYILTRNMGTEAIQGIQLDLSEIKEIDLHPNAFTNMCNLRFLDFCCSNEKLELDSLSDCSCNEENPKKIRAIKRLKFGSSDLTYFRWHAYPMKSLPEGFHPNNLVALVMPHSKVKQLWTGTQHLDNLKHINLSCSKSLIKIPDLSLAQNLERLILEGCTSLIGISSSIQYLNNLVVLNLRDCESLTSLPSSIHSRSLEFVFLSGCSSLKTAPTFPCNMKFLYLKGTAISEFPFIENPSRLSFLDLGNCTSLEILPSSFCKLKSLEDLSLVGCSKLERLPDDFGDLESLSSLRADVTLTRGLPVSIRRLNNLQDLSFYWSSNSEASMGLVLPSLSVFTSVIYLDLSDCGINELPDSLGHLCSLKELYLDENYFESIPTSIKDLSKLEFLGISKCERLQCLPELAGSLENPLLSGLDIQAFNCQSLEKLSDLSFLFSTSSLLSPPQLNLANCMKLDGNAIADKLKDCLLRFQINKDELNEKGLYERVRGCICYPGNEIPEWFSFQTTGSSMTMELPQDWDNESFLGLALCAIVEFPDRNASQKFWVSWSLKIKIEDVHDDIEEYSEHLRAWRSKNGGSAIQTDHVFLGFEYFSSDESDEWSPGDKAYIDLRGVNNAYFECNAHDDEWSVEVKKCGIHFVYAH